MKDVLKDSELVKASGAKVDRVEMSNRLVEAPCVVVASSYGYSAQQERAMKAQSFQNKEMMMMMAGSKVLELNPSHPLIAALLERVKADKDDATAKKQAAILFQAAMLESGF